MSKGRVRPGGKLRYAIERAKQSADDAINIGVALRAQFINTRHHVAKRRLHLRDRAFGVGFSLTSQAFPMF